SDDTLASVAWSTNIAWSHDLDEVFGTHTPCSRCSRKCDCRTARSRSPAATDTANTRPGIRPKTPATGQLPMHPAIRQDENYRTDQPVARPKVSGTAMDDLRASHLCGWPFCQSNNRRFGRITRSGNHRIRLLSVMAVVLTSRPSLGISSWPSTHAARGKRHQFEIDLGEISVRQPRTRRTDKINMSRGVRSYSSHF